MTTQLPPIRTGSPRAAHGTINPIADVEIPFGVVEGAQPGPCLLVTAGVHGSEYCGIETALRLLQTAPARLKGSLLVLPTLNVEAFRKRSIYVMPQDGRNLNRMFPGKVDGTASERLAHWLVTSVYPQADAYLDLHSGDLDEALAPFTIYPNGSAPAQALAAAFGLPVAVAAGGKGYTIDAAHKLGVPSIIAEVSGNGLWSEATVATMTAGIERVMHHLGMIGAPVAPPPAPPRLMTMWTPAAPCDGLWYPAKDLSDPVASGAVLGEIKDVFGAVRATIRSEKDGVVLYRLTSLAVNQGEALIGVGTPLAG
jgi:predicted deacylase